MSWNNIQTRSGTAISALSLDANEIVTWVRATEVGAAARLDGPAYYRIDNRIRTVPGRESYVTQHRLPNSDLLILDGTVGVEALPTSIRSGIDDPAHYAAWALREALITRGVNVKGDVRARHRAHANDIPHSDDNAPALARVPRLPISEDAFIINTISQNLYAELLLRRIGRISGSGSIADGQAALQAVMDGAGISRDGYDLSDGSGMSTYNRLSPRVTVALLRWAAGQPWGAEWRATLPVAGKSGTLIRRFGSTSLEGLMSAKTGSLNASAALSGYMQARSGAPLIFAIFANDYPEARAKEAMATMDAAVLAIAHAN